MSFNPDAIFTSLSKAITDPVNKSIDEVIANLSNALATPVKLMAIILIIFYGYRLILGKGTLSANDVVGIICKISIVTILVTKAGDFNYYVKDFFFKTLPESITQSMSSSTPVDANAFDNIAYGTFKKMEILLKDVKWYYIHLHLFGRFVAYLVCGFCIIGFIVQLIAQVGLALVIALGPLFIALYMWDATKKFTEAWITQAANFIILQILVVLLANILAGVFNQFLAGDWTNVMKLTIPAIVISVVGGFLLLMLPSIASALAGGGASLTAAVSPFSTAINPFIAAMRWRANRREKQYQRQQLQLLQQIAKQTQK